MFQVMPPLSASDYEALKSDIAERGVMVPIEVDEAGNVLDGHHRVRICEELGIPCPKFVRSGMSEPEKRAHALALNLCRRQLTREQREPIWLELRRSGMSYRDIADADGLTSVRTIRRSVEGVADATPDLPDTVTGKDGKNYPARRPVTRYIDDTPEGIRAAQERAKEIRAEKSAASREARLQNIAEISAGNTDLPAGRRYPVIYADPPWRYENPPMGSTSRSIENHYPTMTLDEICALDVRNLATDDAILYLWATAPKLYECMKVLDAWGFEYRTNIVWDKLKIGMGYHARNQHELLLIAKRGSIPPPKAGEQPASVIRVERGAHSAKPTEFYEIIETAYPGLPKIELFSRSPRDGWDSWGNQAKVAK